MVLMELVNVSVIAVRVRCSPIKLFRLSGLGKTRARAPCASVNGAQLEYYLFWQSTLNCVTQSSFYTGFSQWPRARTLFRAL